VGIITIFTYFRLETPRPNGAFRPRLFLRVPISDATIALHYCTRVIGWGRAGDRRRHVRVRRVNDSVGDYFYLHRRKRANRGARQYNNNTYHCYYHYTRVGQERDMIIILLRSHARRSRNNHFDQFAVTGVYYHRLKPDLTGRCNNNIIHSGIRVIIIGTLLWPSRNRPAAVIVVPRCAIPAKVLFNN